MTFHRSTAVVILAALLLSLPCRAAPPADRLEIRGDLPKTGALSREELAAIGTVEGQWTRHEKSHTFRGVPLDAVLTHQGFARSDMKGASSKADKAPEWKKVVLATAADGFQALFTCAELMPAMGPTRAFVVWEVDGAPLPADQGPFRLIVTTDQEGSRSAYALRRLEVLDIRKLAPKRR